MSKKVYKNASSALDGLTFDGMTVMSGGFGLCGIAENLIAALRDSGAKNITAISNNAGVDGSQGTLAERIRAGGAGIPGFFTKTGVGTVIAEGKPHQDFDGETYIMETGLKADLSIIKAWKGDTEGNLIFKATARNFNSMMAMAGKVTVAEVDELVEPGELDPNFIHTPGIFVQRIVEAKCEKRIEQLTTRERT